MRLGDGFLDSTRCYSAGMLKTSKAVARRARPGSRIRSKQQAIGLAGGRQIEIVREPDVEVVRILEGNKRPAMSVRITSQGLDVTLDGASLTLRAAGTLNLEAEHLRLTGRSGVCLRSEGDAVIEVAGKLQTTARSQALVATLGEVHVSANDDVKLDGERILLNS